MRYGSVCSGIEAATAAWHHMGWEPAFFSEIEKFPRAVLEHHYPEVPLHGDFTTIERNQYGKIDLLVGGTPCQSFSVAGLRGGLDDDRGNLSLEFCRLAQREQPRWIVWENVPGVLSSGGGRDFGSILGALEDLGYGLAYRVLDAQYFGVAQRRRRVFVVGYLGDWRPAAAVLFERHSMSGHPAPSREARKDVAGSLTSRSSGGGGGPGAGTDEAAAGYLQPWPADVATGRQRSGVDWPAEVASTLEAGFAKHHGQENQHINNGAALFVPVTSHAITASLANSATGHNKDENVIAFDAYNQAETDEVSKTVAARNDQDTASCVAYAIQAGALRTNPNSGPDGVGVQADHAYTLEARSEVQAVVAEYYSHDYCQDRIYSSQGISPAINCTQRHKVRAFSIMPMNSGRDYKGRETDVAQPPTAAGPPTGAQGGDVIVSFAQNTRDEVRLYGGDGAIVGALAAQPGMKQTNYIATFSDDGSARTLTARHDSSPCVDCGPDVVAFEWQRGATQNMETTAGFSPALIKSQTPAVFVDVYNGAITGDVSATVCASGSPASSAGPQVLTAGPYTIMERGRAGGSNLEYRQDGTANTLLTPNGGRGGFGVGAVAFQPTAAIGFYANEGTHGAGDNVNMSPTLKAHPACSNLAAVATQSAVRRLTPVECERLQGFPDNFTAIPWRKKGAEDCPDGPRYKALGNSMAVPVMRWIGERIQVIDDFVSLI